MRCRIKLSLWLAAVMICLFALGGVAAAQGFSADVVMKCDQQTMQGKIYVTTGKMRFESAGTITITRMDKKLVWVLMPTEKLYMEQDIKLQNIIPGSESAPGEIERTLLGQETVNGYLCNKYSVTVKTDDQTDCYLLWLMADSNLPVKMADEEGRWVQEYFNITTGDQPDSLFEIPAGYEKFGLSSDYGE